MLVVFIQFINSTKIIGIWRYGCLDLSSEQGPMEYFVLLLSIGSLFIPQYGLAYFMLFLIN